MSIVNINLLNKKLLTIFCSQNIEYFIALGFDDAIDIFERQVLIFICPNEEFISKVNTLIKKIGINYIDEIENDISLLDELL